MCKHTYIHTYKHICNHNKVNITCTCASMYTHPCLHIHSGMHTDMCSVNVQRVDMDIDMDACTRAHVRHFRGSPNIVSFLLASL